MRAAEKRPTTATETILVVDDDARVTRSVETVLRDEGFRVVVASGGMEALDMLDSAGPDLVLLDVWMPDLDGIEVLERLRIRRPELPVVVISGHGTVELAVKATRLGAVDFIEKPFSIDGLLGTVKRALGHATLGETDTDDDASTATHPSGSPARGPRVRRRTLASSVVSGGLGLHSGVRTGLILHPLPAGSGIRFARVGGEGHIDAVVENVDSTGYATSLYKDGMGARTVEHLMATLHAYGVTDLLVKVEGEVPILDGSALRLCELIESVGVRDLDATVEALVVDREVRVDAGEDRAIVVTPYDGLRVTYELVYPEPVGAQTYSFDLTGPAAFKADIAPARTFGFVDEIRALEAAGLGQGGQLGNFILIGDGGIVNTELRFPEELARHKILDILGDLYLLGRPLRGAVHAHKTGHAQNVELVRRLTARA